VRHYHLKHSPITIGRAADNDVVLNDRMVSRYHAHLDLVNEVFNITDIGSLNGTLLNDKPITPNSPHHLNYEDIIVIGNCAITLKLIQEEHPDGRVTPGIPLPDPKGRSHIMIGRDPGNDISIEHPTVSRKHSRIYRSDKTKGYYIEDLGSTNGTFVNNERITQPHLLRLDDVIHIGPYKLIYKPEAPLEAVDESRHIRLDALHLKKIVGKGVNLLKDISLTVMPREFVAIVGVSGAGKSTFLDALSGFRPATEGRILVNKSDLYANFDVYRAQLGYVPQRDIIHTGLTVYEALNYSARLRLPSDTTTAEKEKRIDEVLATLGLRDCKDRLIRKLSGGEQRRVSIGVELLAKPGLLFLDEATSGLDPGSERLMMRLLRKLAEQGHTVLLITHATKNVTECNLVIFLARGGHLAYYGPPEEALSYFGVSDFDDIYDKLQGEKTPEAWAQHYRKSGQYKKFVVERMPHDKVMPSRLPHHRRTAIPGVTIKHVSALQQFIILSRRNINILLRDKASLILMLLMAPIIGMLDFIFWKAGTFDATGGDATRGVMVLFMAAVICFLVGGLASMREIVKEADIYRRERMVTLKILPYVLSKIWLSLLVAIYSAGVFILFMILAGSWPPMDQFWAVFVTMTLALLAGMMTGLFISAVSPNQNVTPLLLLLFLVPHIIFGGIMPAKYFGTTGDVISQATSTKWAFESLVTISGMGNCVADPQCRALNCTGPNTLTECEFPGVRPEVQLTDNESRQAAIAEAQASIEIADEDYGHAFNVNIYAHWGILLGIMSFLIVLVTGVLKWKDRR